MDITNPLVYGIPCFVGQFGPKPFATLHRTVANLEVNQAADSLEVSLKKIDALVKPKAYGL